MPKAKDTQPSPLDELRASNIDIWAAIGDYTQPSDEELASVVKELRGERDEWLVKQDKKEA